MVLSSNPQPSAGNGFALGAHVLNFGVLGKVVEVREDGLLVLLSVGLGGDFSKWVADPSKCQECEPR